MGGRGEGRGEIGGAEWGGCVWQSRWREGGLVARGKGRGCDGGLRC